MKESKISIRETISLSLRGYKVWWVENPKILLSAAAHAIIKSLLPYVSLWILARLINEIAGGRDRRIILFLVISETALTAAFTMLRAGLERWKNVQWAGIWHIQNKIFMNKLFAMDFAAVSDPHTQDLRFRIWQNDSSGAWGLYKLLFCFEDLFHAVLSLLGAAALTVSLFTRKVPEGVLAILNSPFFVILILAAMLSATFLAPFFSVKAGYYWVKYAEEHKLGNRLFSFWLGVLGSDRSRAPDVRIYRQDILSKYNLEQNNPFGADSKLAKAANGPMGGLNALSGAVSQVFAGIAYMFVCLKALGGAFGVGSVTQYIGAITALSNGISLLISTIGNLRNNAAFLKIVFEFLDIPDGMDNGRLAVEKKDSLDFVIEFCNVSFRYPGQESYALRNLSLTFRTGGRLAVVGTNGSGKTTFIKLLCRLYDPTEGKILLNGIDIREYEYCEYMSIFSVIFQDFRLLPFGLGQNVAAKINYDGIRAEKCLDHAGFGERLRELPQRLATVLYQDFEKNGIDISGGEAQKIALARALYRDAVFIVLDEPTAALDPIAEYEVYGRMNEIIDNRTAVFISHRLSSCRFCQDIAVFHQGSLVQRGSHDELLRDKNGKYFELWNAQAQYYTN